MMQFFEFFFAGPGWGWKALGLILLVNVVFNGIAEVIKAINERTLNRELVDFVLEKCDRDSAEGVWGEKPATKDDVRS